jgi:acylphosphatase
VEAVVEGPRNLIERMIQYLRQGPAMARVDDIDITWADATGKFRNFGIRH